MVNPNHSVRFNVRTTREKKQPKIVCHKFLFKQQLLFDVRRGACVSAYISRPFIEQISIPLVGSDWIQLWFSLTEFFSIYILLLFSCRFLGRRSCSAWQQNCSRTADGAWKHLFPIFMNYGLYKSQSPTAEPLCNDYSKSPLFAGGVAHRAAACSQVQTETGRGAKKKKLGHLTLQDLYTTAETNCRGGWNERPSYAILAHPRDDLSRNYYGNIASNK